MEDKIVVRVPQRRYGLGQFTDLEHGKLNLGTRLGACGALMSNVVQYLVGAPLVDYSSLQFSASTGSADMMVTSIDTSRPSSRPGAYLDDSRAYTRYTDALMQNRVASDKSVATGTFTISVATSGTNYVVSHPTLGDPNLANFLYDAVGGLQTGAMDASTDFYDVNGNFLVAIHIQSNTVPINTAASLSFDVVNPTYTESLNWSDPCNSTMSGNESSGAVAALMFDTGRNQDLDPSDALALYDIQGLGFQGRNIDTQVFPMATLSNSVNVATGGFYAPDLYSTSTNGIYSQFGAGRGYGTVDPCSNDDRAVDYFTIFRGHGYFRMLGQVADPATEEPNPDMADHDTAYFFGMFAPYEEVSEYPHPMAFLGDVGSRSTGGAGGVPNRTRPWWRANVATLSTSDSNIWSENLFGAGVGFWVLKAPMILGHEFVMDDPSNNTPAQARSFKPAGSTTIGNWKLKGSGTRSITIGSKDDAQPIVTTEFDGQTQAVGWDPVVGYASPQYTAYRWMETPGAPRTLPITLRQLAGDDHSWATATTRRAASDATGGYENIGQIPGMYWGNHIERYDGAVEVLYAPGSEFTTGGRTLRTVIGMSQSGGATYNFAVPATGSSATGNLLFDMNEI